MSDEHDEWTDDALDRMRHEMDSDDGSPPELWDPEPGDQLVGKLLRLEERETRLGSAQVAIIADAENGELWSVFLTRTVLRNEFERQAPRPGDIVGIKFHGQKPFRAGEGTYFHYTVRVSRAPSRDQLSVGTAASHAAPATSARPSSDAESDQELPF